MPNISRIFGPLDTSVSALQAQRHRIDVVSSNLANAESTRTEEGGPYQRQLVVFEAVLNDAQNAVNGNGGGGQGVRVAATVKDADREQGIKVHMPGHPDANANGDVTMPDIRTAEELADLMSAARSYEANAAAFKITRTIFQRALELGRG